MNKLRITVDGRSYDVTVESLDEPAPTQSPAAQATPIVAPTVARTASASPASTTGGAVVSPLAGRVVSIECTQGQAVEAGVTLLTLEAMKMNTFITAPTAGAVTSILVAAGDPVEEGQVLLTVQ